jgi:ribulose-5-phosphate 4-epimerase/fuculose-1-phosphate aldolase
MDGFGHIPVLLEQTIEGLNIKKDGIYLDGTAGGAGHSFRIASELSDRGELICLDKDPEAVSAVICKNHGPFAWGKDPEDAVHCAVVLEEVAKMAFRTELINPKVQSAPQELQDKHYYRKHGANAYYGQGGAK